MPHDREFTFKFPPQAYGDLIALAEHVSALNKLSAFSGKDAAEDREVAEALSRDLSIPFEISKQLIRSFSALRDGIESTEAETEMLLEALTEHLQGRTELTDSQKAQWKNAQQDIAEALKHNPLRVHGKAKEIAISHQNVLTHSNIFTTIRPVFNENGTAILHMIVSHELLIRYLTGGRREIIQLALDATDLEDLRGQCERAAIKAITVKEEFIAAHPTTVWREPEEKS